MKIIVWGINYRPEPTGIAPYNTDLCEYLQGRGHEVHMVTAFPYYPDWRKRPLDRGRRVQTEMINGVAVHRVWLYVPAKPKALTRMLHEASFALSSLPVLLRLPRPDLLLTVSPPLILGPAAALLAVVRRCPYWFHVQDMQPDAALALGMLRPGLFARTLHALERLAYKQALRVSGITRGMLDLFTAKRVPAERQYFLPNWVPERGCPVPDPSLGPDFRAEHGISPDEFLVTYSGNLGRKQGLEILLEAAALLQACGAAAARQIRFVVAGEGAGKRALAQAIERRGLDRVLLLPLQPDAWFASMLRQTDLAVVTQRKGGGALFFPSKLLTLLSAGKPVLTVSDSGSELAKAVGEGGFGWNVLPETAGPFADILLELASSPEQLAAAGAAGRSWVERFSRERVLADFERHLRSLPALAQKAPAVAVH